MMNIGMAVESLTKKRMLGVIPLWDSHKTFSLWISLASDILANLCIKLGTYESNKPLITVIVAIFFNAEC